MFKYVIESCTWNILTLTEELVESTFVCIDVSQRFSVTWCRGCYNKLLISTRSSLWKFLTFFQNCIFINGCITYNMSDWFSDPRWILCWYIYKWLWTMWIIDWSYLACYKECCVAVYFIDWKKNRCHDNCMIWIILF